MPKYIRTEKGIYEAEEFEIKNTRKPQIFKEGKYYKIISGICYLSLPEAMVIAQADTIEELCDEFVYEMGAEHTLVTIGYEQIRDNILTCELLDMSNLYGAVWTDKGLIYVAKMNEDGELVLI